MFVTFVSSLKLRLKDSVKSKNLSHRSFQHVCDSVFTFIVSVDSSGHSGVNGDQFTLLLCNLDSSLFVSENFVEITFASQPQIY